MRVSGCNPKYLALDTAFPQGRKYRYSESFFQYCRVLYEASVYSTQGGAARRVRATEPGPEELR